LDKGSSSITYSGGPSWRYLEAAPEDYPQTERWTNQYYNGNVAGTSVSVGYGGKNTALIKAYSSATGKDNAVWALDSYTQGGYNDWFLPSSAEMMTMYNRKAYVEGTSSASKLKLAYYWTSTQSDTGTYATQAYAVNCNTGTYILLVKTSQNLVRPVRAF
jgi:hypothetical protein